MPHKDLEAKRKYKREWQKAWRKKNPEKSRELGIRYKDKNPERAKARFARYNLKNKDKRNVDRLRSYHANSEQYRANRKRCIVTRPMPNACEVCGTPFIVSGKAGCLDHDHATGLFRGWLCNSCNCALGFAKDSRDRLQLLINYLDRHELCS